MSKFFHATTRRWSRLTMISALAAAALPLTARADIDWSTADWGGYSVNSLSYWAYSDMSQRTTDEMMQEGMRSKGQSSHTHKQKQKPAALSTASNALASGGFSDERGIEQLAKMYPREQFSARKKEFKQIVASFNQSVQKLYGVPPNNLATGLTTALAGAYSAYHNRTFPDPWVQPLYRQMEALLLQYPGLGERPAEARAGDYQVMVGLGMLLMLGQAELQKRPDAAGQRQLQQAGAQVMKALLKTDLERVEFSAQGLQVR